jgi:signal peptidase II
MTKGRWAILTIALILIADQIIKIWIKTSLPLGGEISVFGNWFTLHFVENNGMAFGLELEGSTGKLLLTTFRLIAVIGIGYYLYKQIKNDAPIGLVISLAFVVAGAFGNIIDSAFYGMMFSESVYGQVAPAVMFPDGGGYSPFLFGKVVDMFHFRFLQGIYPDWIPLVGGEEFMFFRPVFNIADSAITCGVISLILFQKKFFYSKKN